jgi:ribonuclease HI
VKLNEKEPYTKRVILSNISRIFDPLGLASVATIKARIALQEIWKMKKFEWDDLLPKEMQLTWRKLFTEIEDLKTVQFPQCLQPPSAFGSPKVHVFADASILAYGAAAYLVWSSSSGREVRLVSAKARVAPLRQTTIPRLELMAALLATRMAKTIYDKFKIKPSKVTLWSDSMIVLAWLRSESTLLKSFVSVRVAEIQASWEPTDWRYVPTNLNPADDLSRGISVHEMNGRWMNGPSFLRKNSDEWPTEVDKASPEIPAV